ncbi:MAG: T9SS C-terminal target domain-containing protein, partial [Chitinophagales bacterium]|nr:T9SS C-terminal target domain-containing protein [Chitinophagales bacterium]
MKKIIQIAFSPAIFFLFNSLQAQVPAIEWQKCLGGSNNEAAFSIEQTAEGNFIVAGYSDSNDGDVTGNHGSDDYWIVKLDPASNILWQKSLGGNSIDEANSINQTADGGFIVAGFSYSNNGDVTGNNGADDYWIVKLDSTGDILWEKSLGGSGDDGANCIQQTFDGGFIVTGWSSSNDGDVTGNHGLWDYWLVKLDTSGSLEWEKSFGGSLNDMAYSVQQTIDGGFIVAGYSESSDGDVSGNHGFRDYWIIKTDADGNLLWQTFLGGTEYDEAHSIIQLKEGGYLVAGFAGSAYGDVTGNHG